MTTISTPKVFFKRDLFMILLMTTAIYLLFSAFPKVDASPTAPEVQASEIGLEANEASVVTEAAPKPVSKLVAYASFSLEGKTIYKQGMTAGVPVKIIIPSIGVNARVLGVGLTSTGAMDSPKGPKEVGWFNLGPRPGQAGSSVLAGHSSWRNDIPAAFDRLKNMKVGDKVYIQDDKGVVVVFKVREIRTFDREADPSVVFESSDSRHLNLITCAGAWDYDAGTSEKRLVVFTDLVE